MVINIEKNKEKFLRILDYVDREGLDKLKDLLNRTDFFTAPASTTYHSNVEGGLCQHSLLVFESLVNLMALKSKQKGKDFVFGDIAKVLDGTGLHPMEKQELDTAASELFGPKVNFSSVVVVSLLHDLHKLNLYEKYEKSVYKGTDDYGKKIWDKEVAWKKRDDAFIFGDDGSNSNYFIRACIAMTYEEQLAIQNHMGIVDMHVQLSASKAWARSPLALYLHLADMEATYFYEQNGNEVGKDEK